MSDVPQSAEVDAHEADAPTRRCPDCDAAVGAPHQTGCDVQRCSVCAGQRLGCEGDPACAAHDPAAVPWTGEWPGVAECRMRGWYATMVPGRGFAPCDADAEGATEDLNRLAYFQQAGVDGLYDTRS